MRYKSNAIKNLVLMLGIFAIYSCNSNPNPNNPAEKQPTSPASTTTPEMPKFISFDIVNEYPHDPAAFTEGLEYHDGVLYESTGEYGTSELRKVDLKTGKVLQSVKLENQYFGEGLTIMGNKIYQLTYREGKGFVYDLATLKLQRTFTFATSEGWGMTNNGASLIFDDGTNILHFLDPVSFTETKTLTVTDEHGPVNEINEPEMINGFIYANIWKTELIIKIDTATGKVVGRADLSPLRHCGGISNATGRRGQPDVMNGIAYDVAQNKVYITGKNWPKLFEIKLDN